MQRSIDDVVSTLKAVKESGRRCSLLIGAGCSVKAGIPLASTFVDIIKNDHQAAYERAEKKTYPHCMYQLPSGIRRDLIARFVDQAKINWAHIAIAQLIKSDYIDRVLTPNFDPLVMRACALVGEFPAVYDFAASQMFKAAYIPDKAIFHLHGQRSGFRLLHTEEEVNALSTALAPVFEDAGKGRMWLVVGYSGDNDPVFEHLARVQEFDYGLYWLTYRDEKPAAHVQEKLLAQGKQAYYVNGYDADEFFVELAKRLDCFPPDLISRPFTHMDGLLQMLTRVELPVSSRASEEFDFVAQTRELLGFAIKRYEEFNAAVEDDSDKQATLKAIIAAQKAMLSGNLAEAVNRIAEMPAAQDPEVMRLNAWAYILAGDRDCEMALQSSQSSEDADRLYAQAGEKYQAALTIKPDMHEALNNWGLALSDQAKIKQGEAADRLYAQAGEKYQAALTIKPDMHEALNNWGNALSNQAKNKQGEEADRLYTQAGEKYQATLIIKPDMHEVLNNWGNALSDQAKIKQGDETDRLYAQAGEKYQAALAIKPDKHEALYNWGSALSDQALIKQGEEADRLYTQAGEKYQAALTIKPDKHEALNNWGNALSDQAKIKHGDEADRLYAQAGEKYQAALAIKPDKHEVLYNWGSALSDQALIKQGEEADWLYTQAGEKYQAALALKPDKREALNNWGSALSDQAKTKQGEEADRLYAQAGEKYQAALAIKPDYYDAINNWGSALSDQAKTKQGEQAERLFQLAEQKLHDAEIICPGSGAYNLACIASLTGREDTAKKWLELAKAQGKLPDREHLTKDEDLANIRYCEWFGDLV